MPKTDKEFCSRNCQVGEGHSIPAKDFGEKQITKAYLIATGEWRPESVLLQRLQLGCLSMVLGGKNET